LMPSLTRSQKKCGIEKREFIYMDCFYRFQPHFCGSLALKPRPGSLLLVSKPSSHDPAQGPPTITGRKGVRWRILCPAIGKTSEMCRGERVPTPGGILQGMCLGNQPSRALFS